MRPKKVVLVVDDSEVQVSLRRYVLRTRGYEVLSALSGAEALRVVEERLPGELDLLVTDLRMPGMDGAELVRRVKAARPEIASLLVSGRVKEYDDAMPADSFLPKGSLNAEALLERVKVLTARKRGPKTRMLVDSPAGLMDVMVGP